MRSVGVALDGDLQGGWDDFQCYQAKVFSKSPTAPLMCMQFILMETSLSMHMPGINSQIILTFTLFTYIPTGF